MPADVSVLAALLVGLMGGAHCAGMCGGIVGALSAGLPATRGRSPTAALPYQLAYNAGRIASYTLAGALLGGIGGLSTHLTDIHVAQRALQLLAGIFMLALGLYLGGWWTGLARLERLGGVLWRNIEPLGRRLIPITSLRQACALGLIWGWLPCGLVYSVLVWSISAGSTFAGGLLMLSFGIGTLPTLLTMGAMASGFLHWTRQPRVRAAAGATVAAFGGYTIWLAVG